MRPAGGGPFNDGIARYAPFLFGVLLVIAVAAVVINFIQDRADPRPEGERFDPVRNFSRLNSRGMVDVMMRRPARPPRETQEKTYEEEPLVQR